MKRRTLLKGILVGAGGLTTKQSLDVLTASPGEHKRPKETDGSINAEIALLDNKGEEISGDGYTRQRFRIGIREKGLTNLDAVSFTATGKTWPTVSQFALMNGEKPLVTGRLAHSGVTLFDGDTAHFEAEAMTIILG